MPRLREIRTCALLIAKQRSFTFAKLALSLAVKLQISSNTPPLLLKFDRCH